MSEHRATLSWSRSGGAFELREYTRTHQWTFPRSNQSLQASAAVAYRGTDDCVDPEEGYTAALASCHMLTFLAVAAISGYVIDRYDDSPVGYLEKGPDGKPWLARVILHPRVQFSGEKQPSTEDVEKLHEKAHHGCFLANSVRTAIIWELS